MSHRSGSDPSATCRRRPASAATARRLQRGAGPDHAPLATPALAGRESSSRGWMHEAGLTTAATRSATSIGRRDGRGPRTLVLGSHLDSVRRRRPLRRLARRARRRSRSPSAAATAAAVASRSSRSPTRRACASGTAYLGSRAFAGRLRPGLARAARRRRRHARRRDARLGGDPARRRARDPTTCAATSRSTSSRARCSRPRTRRSASSPRSPARRRATSPSTAAPATRARRRWTLRRDALAAAAEWILAAEATRAPSRAWSPPSARSRVPPGAAQRDPRARRRRRSTSATPTTPSARERSPRCATSARGDRRRAAASRSTGTPCGETAAAPTSPTWPPRARRRGRGDRRPRRAAAQRRRPRRASRWPAVTEIAMLFVRCAGGISHHPDESVGRGRRRGRDRRRSSASSRSLRVSVATCIVRGGTSSPPGAALDVGVEDGAIAAVGRELRGAPREEIDATRAARAPRRRRRARALQRARPHRLGGLGDRHARRSPPAARRRSSTCRSTRTRRRSTRAAFDAKRRRRARGRASSTSRSGAASCPATLERLDELAERGVVGFKAFMCDSGIDDFAAADDVDAARGDGARRARLGAARRRARRERRARRSRAPRGARTWRDWLASRPVGRRARGDRPRDRASPRTPAARCTSCTSPRGARRRARRRGARPRRRRDLRDLPALPRARRRGRRARSARVAKCAPPLRDADERERCGSALGDVALRRLRPLAVPAGLKAGELRAPGAGSPAPDDARRCCSTSGRPRRWPAVASPTSSPAPRAPLPARAQGRDRARRRRRPRARRPAADETIAHRRLLDRHPVSPFAGRRTRARVARTLLRGATVALGGQLAGRRAGAWSRAG